MSRINNNCNISQQIKTQHDVSCCSESKEVEKLNIQKIKQQLKFDRVTNKINVLSNFNFKSKQEISTTSVTCDEFDTFSQLITNYDDEIYDFLKNLIKTGHFFIGGSFGTIFAHLLLGENINLDLYKDADIDIYCCSTMEVQILDSMLKHIASKLILNKKCIIYKTDILANIIFENPEYRKIQIIFQVKKNIDEHLAFIDLPVTEFTIGYKNNEFIMYYTQLSLLALYKKINVIFNPKSKITDNRVLKYNNRGYISVVAENGKITKICENNDLYKQFIRFAWYDINCDLDDLIKNIDEYHECILHNKDIIKPNNAELKLKSNSKLIWFLINNKIIDCIECEKIRTVYETTTLPKESYDHNYFQTWRETKRIYKHIVEKIKTIKASIKYKYCYVDDESNHQFEQLSFNPDFFKETIMNPDDFLKLQHNYFFAHTVKRFLKKQGVYIYNDLYCTKEQYFVQHEFSN